MDHGHATIGHVRMYIIHEPKPLRVYAYVRMHYAFGLADALIINAMLS